MIISLTKKLCQLHDELKIYVDKLPESFLENLSVFSQRADATLHRKYAGSRICVQVFEPSMKEQGKNALGLSGFLFLKVQLSSLMNTTSVHCLQG